MRGVAFVLLLVFSSGCASTSNRTKTILTMVGVGIIAGTLAANKAPSDENPMAHALVWGGGSAALTGIAGMYVFDEEAKRIEVERKLSVAQAEIDSYRGESMNSSPHLLMQSDNALGRELPEEYRNLVKPGKWSLYRTNTWVQQGENSFVHQDKLIKIEPPQFQPNKTTESQQ